jgi:diguanylate cyclase (GGDEF)-like protein/PAS domain S-box-containing protein
MSAEPRKVAPELRALLDASPDAVLLVDRAGHIVALNHRVEALFLTPAGRLLGQPVEVLLPESARGPHASSRGAYARAPTVRAMSTRGGLAGLRADGSEFPVEIALTPIAGSAEGLVMAVVHDVSSRPPLTQLVGPPDGMREALDALADAVLTVDLHGDVDFMNRAAEQLTGVARETARGRPLAEVLPLRSEAGGASMQDVTQACLREGVASGTFEALSSAPDAREHRVLDLTTTPIRDAAGTITGATVLARDVTRARLIAHELSHQAAHDPLTGLVNRREFEERLGRALASGAGERREHAVCFIDLDGFKRVNDTCGHGAGDEVLRQLSEVMGGQLRSRDTLARLGGDEFGLLLEHCGPARAARIADKIRAAICAYRFTRGTETYAVGASIGVVTLEAGRGQPGDVIRAADAACYRAKRAGGNRIQLSTFEPSGASAPFQGVWSAHLRTAIGDRRFRLHAQPLEPLDGGKPGPRLELLLRLDDGKGQLLAPHAFLRAARREGLMPAIDRWVIREAIQRLAEWQRAHPGAEPPIVAVNVDEETVAAGDLVPLVRAELAGAALPTGSLCFEIGESVAVSHPVPAADFCRDLRGIGCQTTVEHCGSGMAAFTLLRRLRPDYLKIAGHIVRGMVKDPVHRALASALNEVGHVLGLRTIGVHVENRRVLGRLRQLGVDFAQGFGIGRPEPLEDALARLG